MKHRDVARRLRPPGPLTRARVEGTLRRVRARLRQGQQSQEVIALCATGQLGMAATGQIQLTVVTRHAREDPHIPQPHVREVLPQGADYLVKDLLGPLGLH